MEHLLLECPYAVEMWGGLAASLRRPDLKGQNYCEIVYGVFRDHLQGYSGSTVVLINALVKYRLWIPRSLLPTEKVLVPVTCAVGQVIEQVKKIKQGERGRWDTKSWGRRWAGVQI
ncbi:hypothetical protein FKM82_030880 [Ascaphus truei]